VKVNREGNLVGVNKRQCSSKECDNMFNITSKTVTICPTCNSERVKSEAPEELLKFADWVITRYR
jgi:Zn finger protein HypA/HybF involved in hydrogenase expression